MNIGNRKLVKLATKFKAKGYPVAVTFRPHHYTELRVWGMNGAVLLFGNEIGSVRRLYKKYMNILQGKMNK